MSGSSLKILLQRCKHLTCLLLQQTGLVGDQVTGAEWDKGGGETTPRSNYLSCCYICYHKRHPQYEQLITLSLPEQAVSLQELDITATDLSTATITDILTR